MSGVVLADETPVARKEHSCELCSATIQPGDRYRRTRIIGDDGPYVFKACELCNALTPIVLDWLADPYEGYGEDDFVEWANDYLDDPEHGEDARAYLDRREVAHAAWVARVQAATETTS
jgi:hypothetical protein